MGLKLSAVPGSSPLASPRQSEVLWKEVLALRQSHGRQRKATAKVGLCLLPPTPRKVPFSRDQAQSLMNVCFLFS